MQEELKKDVAVFRFSVIAELVGGRKLNKGLADSEKIYPDRRKFESLHANDMWQSDCMYGPYVNVDGKMRRAYLFAIIDDASRLITHAEFYLQQNLDCYKDCIIKALSKRGLPKKLYVDNGPAFKSKELGYATASLGIALIYAKPYQPEGKGKIERWFKTVRMQFLPLCNDALTLDALNTLLIGLTMNTITEFIRQLTKLLMLDILRIFN